MSRRFFWFAFAIVAGIALYTAGWFYAADRLADEVRTALADFSREGTNRAVCEAPEIRGFPFRIGLFCAATYFERGDSGFSVSTEAFRSAAQIYAPRRVIAEADGPARLVLPGLVPLDLTWGSLQASARLALPLPERVSLAGSDLTAVASMPNVEGPHAFTAASLELHMQPAAPDVDVAIRFSGFEPGKLLLPTGTLPPLTGLADLVLKDGMETLRERRGGLRGASFEVRQLEVGTPDGTRLTATGTLAIGDDGLIDAELMLGTTDVRALAGVIAAAFPEGGEGLGGGIAALSALGPDPQLPLTIRDGQARLGFIDLGTIPPL